jgi:phospholipid/cholesterol/gamma-HCH transport system substrate-binding protein
MSKKTIEVLVGLFVLLGLAAMVFLALQAGNLAASSNNGTSYTLQARFDNIGGLKVRAPVRSAGVNVGRVSKITLDPQSYLGVVTLEVQDRFQFPRDSSAKILTSGLLGDQYVGIEPGGDEKNLEAGAVITRTQSAIVLENLIGQVLFNRAADAGSTAPAASAQPAPAGASGAKP